MQRDYYDIYMDIHVYVWTYHAKQRRTWGGLNPVTRSVPSGKTYNRKKEKQRIGKEFRNGFEADLFLQNYLFLLDYDVTQ